MKILLSAYACEPGRGSEAGVGWNVCCGMAKYHEIWVLTQAKHRSAIEAELKRNPVSGLHFVYFELPPLARFWDHRQQGEWFYYYLWQIGIYSIAQKLLREHSFDLVHHITLNQYRTPSFGFQLKDVPFVFGPVGGAEIIPLQLFRDLSLATTLKESVRIIDATLPRIRKIKPKNVFWLFTNPATKKRFESHLYENNWAILAPLGIQVDELSISNVKPTEPNTKFRLLYAGRLDDWKGISFLLKVLQITVNRVGKESIHLEIIGATSEKAKKKARDLISSFNLEENVSIIGFLAREKLLKRYAEIDVFVYPAFRDSGSMAILEAYANACPVLCLDIPSQYFIPDKIALKVPLQGSYSEIVKKFVEKLVWAMGRREEIREMGYRGYTYIAEYFTWDNKLKQIEEIYEQAITLSRK